MKTSSVFLGVEIALLWNTFCRAAWKTVLYKDFQDALRERFHAVLLIEDVTLFFRVSWTTSSIKTADNVPLCCQMAPPYCWGWVPGKASQNFWKPEDAILNVGVAL